MQCGQDSFSYDGVQFFVMPRTPDAVLRHAQDETRTPEALLLLYNCFLRKMSLVSDCVVVCVEFGLAQMAHTRSRQQLLGDDIFL